MPFTWDDASQKRLLLIIIHLTGNTTPKWADVAPLMGKDCTAEAARQQFKTLKAKEAKKEFGEIIPEAGGATPTPAKKKAPTPRKRKSAVATVAADASAEDGDDHEEESPIKKVKAEVEVKDDGGED